MTSDAPHPLRLAHQRKNMNWVVVQPVRSLERAVQSILGPVQWLLLPSGLCLRPEKSQETPLYSAFPPLPGSTERSQWGVRHRVQSREQQKNSRPFRELAKRLEKLFNSPPGESAEWLREIRDLLILTEFPDAPLRPAPGTKLLSRLRAFQFHGRSPTEGDFEATPFCEFSISALRHQIEMAKGNPIPALRWREESAECPT